MLRISLDDLSKPDQIGPTIGVYRNPDLPRTSHTDTPIQGANDTMYWGVHLTNDLMRLHKWPDSAAAQSVEKYDRSVPAWSVLKRSEGHFEPSSGANSVFFNWCARSQSKIRGAFMTGNIIGFLWDAGVGGVSKNNATFTYPYIDVATFNVSNNMTYTGQPYLWSPVFAWLYGNASPDSNGNVAIQAFYGGGDYTPSVAAGTGNDFKGTTPLPWKMMRLVNGTDFPQGDSDTA